jgi:lipid-binding SYLF domain-containing protein
VEGVIGNRNEESTRFLTWRTEYIFMKTFTSMMAAVCLIVPMLAQGADPASEVRRAGETIRRLNRIPESGIPLSILRNARGLAIIRVYKAGFGISGRVGNGVVVARTGRGWSGPAFISLAGAGVGPQIGAQSTDFVLVLNTQGAVDAFARGVNVTLGGDLSVAVGPVGRTAELGVTPIAAVYTYSQSRGLFAGASLEGSVIVTRPGANAAFYGRQVAATQVLGGNVRPPGAAAPLLSALQGARRNSGARVAQR